MERQRAGPERAGPLRVSMSIACFRRSRREGNRLTVITATQEVVGPGVDALRQEMDAAIREGEIRAAGVPRGKAPGDVPVAAVLVPRTFAMSRTFADPDRLRTG